MPEFRKDLDQKSREELLELLITYQRAIDVNLISSVTDNKGVITYVNEKFCEISKYKRSELIGQTHRVINSYYHPQQFFTEMWETIRSGQIWHNEIKNKAKDGTYYWVDTVIIPVLDEAGNIKQYLSLRMVITERKNAEAAQAEYNQKLKDILYMTSHRVRSPLTTCMGLLNMVSEDKVPSPEELKDLIKLLKVSAEQLNEFTKDLTDYLLTLEKRYEQANTGKGNHNSINA